jgi:hypothetical protein
MAAKDRFPVGIKCPTCTQKGTLHLSENDYPFMRKVGREVDGVDGDFKAEMYGDLKVLIKCGKCGDDFFYPPEEH